jgi:hypothetical protein
LTGWKEWREHPERLWIHKASFQIHFWVGMVATLYMFLMSISGSVIVYRQFFPGFPTCTSAGLTGLREFFGPLPG